MNQLYNPLVDVYISLWNKYRPAVLQRMLAAAKEPQRYQFFAHEFKSLNAREKGGYAFTLQVHDGKATNNIKDSRVAQQLLAVLLQSKKGSELLTTGDYEFVLDKDFVLTIRKLDPLTE